MKLKTIKIQGKDYVEYTRFAVHRSYITMMPFKLEVGTPLD